MCVRACIRKRKNTKMLLFWKQESEMTFRNATHISYLIILIMCKCNNKIKEFWIFIYFTQFDDFWQSLVLLEKFFLSIQSQPPKPKPKRTKNIEEASSMHRFFQGYSRQLWDILLFGRSIIQFIIANSKCKVRSPQKSLALCLSSALARILELLKAYL